jgi:hypothetical protein
VAFKRIHRKKTSLSKSLILLAGIIIFSARAGALHGYTYTYHNRTDYPIRVNIQLYGDADQSGLTENRRPYTVSTGLLLKSWSAEVLIDATWRLILHLTCDFLPGNQVFTLFVQETSGPDGTVIRSWSAIASDEIPIQEETSGGSRNSKKN